MAGNGEDLGEGDDDMGYGEEFDAEQIFAQIGLTPEQLQNLTEADLAGLSPEQIRGIARLQMHQEQQMQAEGDMGDGMVGGEEYEDLGEMTEAEYLQYEAEEQLKQLKEAFDACDGDQDGALTKDELENLLLSIGADLDDEGVQKVMQVLDTNQDGKIQFEEFLDAM